MRPNEPTNGAPGLGLSVPPDSSNANQTAARRQAARGSRSAQDFSYDTFGNSTSFCAGAEAIAQSHSKEETSPSGRHARGRDQALRSNRPAIDCATGDTAAPQIKTAMVASALLNRFLLFKCDVIQT